jgi:hypothetical protein
MRSELISRANAHIPNRYLLARLASKATRALHRPNTRVEDTLNDVFRVLRRPDSVAEAGPVAEVMAWPEQPGRAVEQDRLLRAG